MKAILLAAGKGTRLKPYTDTVPKCLIPIHGAPLLKIWIDLFDRFGICEVLINTHHHAEKVERFVGTIQDQTRVKLTTVFEKQLLGSGGTLFENRVFVKDCKDFIIAYADNLTNIDLDGMIAYHRQCTAMGGILTMGLFRTTDPENCGIADLDNHNRVVQFVEKPRYPSSNLANAGIFVASQKLFEYTSTFEKENNGSPFDLGLHILPKLVDSMYGYLIKEYLRDIGTVESYHQALEDWPRESKR
ncbi:nucleotidyltransferase family protein [Thermodesulfobacteriota bacterium]